MTFEQPMLIAGAALDPPTQGRADFLVQSLMERARLWLPDEPRHAYFDLQCAHIIAAFCSDPVSAQLWIWGAAEYVTKDVDVPSQSETARRGPKVDDEEGRLPFTQHLVWVDGKFSIWRVYYYKRLVASEREVYSVRYEGHEIHCESADRAHALGDLVQRVKGGAFPASLPCKCEIQARRPHCHGDGSLVGVCPQSLNGATARCRLERTPSVDRWGPEEGHEIQRPPVVRCENGKPKRQRRSCGRAPVQGVLV